MANFQLQVLGKRFPDFRKLIAQSIDDPRDSRGMEYSLSDLICSTICMFSLQQESRNSYNQDRPAITENFQKILGIKLAHGDTCEDLLRKVDPEQTTGLLNSMVSKLIESKVLSQFRYNGKYMVAIDATGVHSFSDDQQGTALRRNSKNGQVHYSSAVLEAKLIGENGFAISLCHEWIQNDPDKPNTKQDCERNAFVRLTQKLKKYYPRLPMILLADALYMSDPVISRCKENNWDFMIVQKENGSDFMREEIQLRPDRKRIQQGSECYEYLNDLPYNEHSVHWIGYTGHSRFAWCTSMEVDSNNVKELSRIARYRWKIENQGFDQQKNHGYKLEHLYSRISPRARSNYYILLQIAHMMDQLVQLEVNFKVEIGNFTQKKLREYLRALLQNTLSKFEKLRNLLNRKQHHYQRE